MKKTRIAFIGAAVVCLAAMLAYVGWQRSADQPTAPSNTAEQNGAQQTELVYYDGTNANDDPYLTEALAGELLHNLYKEANKRDGGDGVFPQEAIEKIRKSAAIGYKAVETKIGRTPRVSDLNFQVKSKRTGDVKKRIVMADYDGPQTVEALMAEFDEEYSRVMTPEGSEIDMIFPRGEWIQRALDVGVKFQDNYDYSGIMQMRGYLARIRREPERYADLIKTHGLENDANYNAFIDKKIMDVAQRNISWRAAVRKDPDSTGGFQLGDQYIATRDNQMHVKIMPDDPSHGVVMYGPQERKLTREERHLLKYHGVAPEGIEVFYIDENNEVMPPDSEPMRLDWKDKVSVMSEHERHAALQEAAAFLNSDKVKVMTIVDWMTLADYTGALLDYTEGSRAGVSDAPPVPPGPSEVPSAPNEQELPRLLPPGVELPKSPGRSREDVDAFFDFLDLHLIENADVPENVRRGLKQRYEAYQMWKSQDRLRRQEPASPSPPANEDGDTSDEEDDE